MDIGFDVINDLFLTDSESLNWEGKATSLYCIVAGNVSSDHRVIAHTLSHLSKFYQGVFYIDGYLEFQDTTDIPQFYKSLSNNISKIQNVVHLRSQVIIINGVAIIGANGWYGIPEDFNKIEYELYRSEDFAYLTKGIEQLQVHNDVKKIVVVTASAPNPDLYFGEYPSDIFQYPPLNLSLFADSEKKVSHWVFGSYKKTVDIVFDNINYVDNFYTKNQPYWPKRISV